MAEGAYLRARLVQRVRCRAFLVSQSAGMSGRRPREHDFSLRQGSTAAARSRAVSGPGISSLAPAGLWVARIPREER